VDASGANTPATSGGLSRERSHHARGTRWCTRNSAELTQKAHPVRNTECLRSQVWIGLSAIKRLHDLICWDRQCARQRIPQLLPSLSESRLHQPPELLLVIVRESGER
jgi:hypothetical protein